MLIGGCGGGAANAADRRSARCGSTCGNGRSCADIDPAKCCALSITSLAMQIERAGDPEGADATLLRICLSGMDVERQQRLSAHRPEYSFCQCECLSGSGRAVICCASFVSGQREAAGLSCQSGVARRSDSFRRARRCSFCEHCRGLRRKSEAYDRASRRRRDRLCHLSGDQPGR